MLSSSAGQETVEAPIVGIGVRIFGAGRACIAGSKSSLFGDHV